MKILITIRGYHNTGGLLPQQRRSLYFQLLRIALMLSESSNHNFARFQGISQLGPLSAVPTAGGFLPGVHSIGHTAYAIEFEGPHFILACSIM